MRGQAIVYETLDRMGIAYETVEHKPVYTIEEMKALDFPPDVMVAKNLFLRDAKGRRHFLVVLRKDRPADLRGMEELLQTSRLSFASEERLTKHLGLAKGAVSQFGLLNDADRKVEAVLDRQLADSARVGLHPNDNSASVFLAFADMVRVIEEHGNGVVYV